MDHQTATSQTNDKIKISKTIWELLNSPFVLFLFTSLIIGGASFLYNEYNSFRKKLDDQETQNAKLKTEIKFRVDTISSIVQPEFTYTTMFSANGALLGEIGNKTSDSIIIGNYSPIYPELANRNLVSLIWELQEMQQNSKNKTELHKAIDAVGRLRWIWDVRTERVKDRIEGTSDSIWHFRSKDDMEEFGKGVSVVRGSLMRLSDVGSKK